MENKSINVSKEWEQLWWNCEFGLKCWKYEPNKFLTLEIREYDPKRSLYRIYKGA